MSESYDTWMTNNQTAAPDGNNWRPIDFKFYSEAIEDPAIRSEMESGYVVSRPRSKRRPRRMWTIGYTDIPFSQMQAIRGYFENRFGGSKMFTWINTIELESERFRTNNPSLAATNYTYTVRFKDGLKFTRTGHGLNLRFSVSFGLEQR